MQTALYTGLMRVCLGLRSLLTRSRTLEEPHIRARFLTTFLTPTLPLLGVAVLVTSVAYTQGTPDGDTPANRRDTGR